MLGISFCDLRCGHATAVGARCTVNGVFHILGNLFKASFHKIVAFHPGAEPLIFLALFFPEPLNLHEVSYQVVFIFLS